MVSFLNFNINLILMGVLKVVIGRFVIVSILIRANSIPIPNSFWVDYIDSDFIILFTCIQLYKQ